MNSPKLAYLTLEEAASLLALNSGVLAMRRESLECVDMGDRVLVAPRSVLLLAELQGETRLRFVAGELVRRAGKENQKWPQAKFDREVERALELIAVPHNVRMELETNGARSDQGDLEPKLEEPAENGAR